MDKVPPVFANGFLHWLIKPCPIRERPSAAIITFSVTDETFGSVRSPPFWEPGAHQLRPSARSSEGEHLVELDNRLCMVRKTSPLAATLEIWKLLNYSPGDWSLSLRIHLSGRVVRCLLRDPQAIKVIGSIGGCKSGKRIVIASSKHKVNDQYEKEIHTYDPRCYALETILTITETHTSVINSRAGSRFSLFEESLVPVHKTDG
jgi:hypothetical protein